MNVETIPSGGALGAEVRGVNLACTMTENVKRKIVDAFHTHQAIFIRNQVLSDQQLLDFSSIFGKVLTDHRPKDYCPELDTEIPGPIDVVSNVVVDGKPIGALGSGEAIWHSDTVPLPNSALVLYALEIPETGGSNTRIASTQAAYEAMSNELRARLRGQIVIHGRQDYDLIKQAEGPDIDPSQSPGPWFPLVRTHVDTGREGLFLGRQGDCYIVDMTVEESNALLSEIWAAVTKPDFVWEHVWAVGDVLVWDNRCTVHSRGEIGAGRRRLHRTTVAGEWPRGARELS